MSKIFNNKFEDIITLDRNYVMEIVMNTQGKDLLFALKNASEELKEKIYSCMSKKMAEQIRADLQSDVNISESDTEAAQKKIAALICELEEKGEINKGVNL